MSLFSFVNTANPLEAAQVYIKHGFPPVPIPHRKKKPVLNNWPSLRLTGDDAAKYFGSGQQNIGIILGDECGLGDFDCDTGEAAVAAQLLLPPTGMIFGRASKHSSHFFYLSSPPTSSLAFKDPTDKKMLIEFRCQKKDGGVGLQTVVPPSVHQDTGEKIQFEPGGDGEPARVDAKELIRAAARVAAAALLARHWPERGSRHEAMLALAGALWHARWPKEAAKKFCDAVYRAVPTHDLAAIGRNDSEVEDSYTRGEKGLEITGQPTLAKIVGEQVVTTAMKWIAPETATIPPTEETDHEPYTETKTNPDTDPPVGHPYREVNGGIVRLKTVRHNGGRIEETTPLTSFTARITADVAEDNGEDVKRHFEIQAEVDQATNRFVIPASTFAEMDWPITQLGPRAIVYPQQREWARTAIQSLSTNIAKKHIYTHTGWLRRGDRDLYLFNGGAISADGVDTTVDVRLAGALSRFELNLPANPTTLTAAIAASLRVLDVAPDPIVFPLLAAAYRAAIKSCDFGLWFAGPTGVFKSELAALAQRHYGSGMDARHLPGNFSSTGNALEALAFHCKDALLVIDDFAPHGGMQDVARYHGAAERILRAAGNSQGRGRLTSTANLRDAKFPRGLILATGEDVPRGQSIRGRVLIVEVAPGDVRTRALTEAQSAAAAGAYCQALAAFLQHIARDYDRLQHLFQEKVLAMRERATKAHSRTPWIVADLQAGFELALNFAVSAGVVDSAHSERLAERCWIALNHVAREQRAPQDASEPAHRFLELLRAAIAAGKAHVCGPNGGEPDNERSWGWRWEDGGKEPKLVAKGSCVGWVDGPNLYLEPTAAYVTVQEFARSTGEPLSVSEGALRKRLKEKGILETMEPGRGTLTIRRTLQGANRQVLHLKAEVMTAVVGFPAEDVGSMSEFSQGPDIEFANSDS